jgi:hypothetical protein
MSALSKLEDGAGIQVVSALSKIPAQLASAAGVDLYDQAALSNRRTCVKVIMDHWKSFGGSRAPTWKSMLDILRELDLEELGQAIEDYLHGEHVQLAWHACSHIQHQVKINGKPGKVYRGFPSSCNEKSEKRLRVYTSKDWACAVSLLSSCKILENPCTLNHTFQVANGHQYVT